MPNRDPRAYEGDLYRIGNRADAGGNLLSPLRYPTNHKEWVDRYNWLFNAYVGEPYSVGDIQALKLFRALDEDGKVIAETRRLTRDIQFVVDADAQALGGELSLDLDVEGEVTSQQEADLETARAIWQRSRVEVEALRWATMCASMGDVHIEAVRQSSTKPYRVSLVAYDPRWVYLVKDEVSGARLQEATVRLGYYDPEEVDDHGVQVKPPIGHTYRRVIDDKEITVWRDGKKAADESGVHNAGVAPLAHLPFKAYAEPEHGLWAAHGLEESLAIIDSLMTQLEAIGNRYGSPIMAVTGATLPSDTDAGKHGRIISGIPTGGSVAYLEANLTAISTLLAAAQEERESVRATLPEFLFTESGANASGDALNFRATAFEAKMRAVRRRWYAELARLMEIAVAMEKDVPWDEDNRWLKVSGGPILPVNVSKELETILKAHENGVLLDRDLVVHTQRLGITPPAEDPEAYAEAVKMEQSGKRDGEVGALERVFGGGGMAADEEPEEGVEMAPDVAPEVDAGGVEKAQDTALNGAQVQAAQGIVESVAAGLLPRETGIEMLSVFFRIPLETAERLMGTVGTAEFQPETPPSDNPAPPPPPRPRDDEDEESEEDEQE